MRTSRLLVLPAALALLTALAPVLPAHADGAGPSIDNASLYNAGRPCSTTTAVVMNDQVLHALQAAGTDDAAQDSQSLTYTFAIWPTADPTGEQDLTTTTTAFGLVTENAPLNFAAGADYSWRVRLTDGNSTSDWSQTCLLHNDPTAPAMPVVTSANYPPGVRGPYGDPAQFSFDAQGDTDTVAFQYALDSGLGVDTTCSQAGPQGQLLCDDPLSASDVLRTDAPGGTAALSVPVTGSAPHYLTVAARDAAGNDSAAVTYTFVGTAPSAPVPTISGQPTAGGTLTATVRDWVPTPTAVGYQWLADGTAIPGATDLTYPVSAADVGTSISFAETGTRTNIGTTTETSAPVLITPLSFALTPTPTISGTLVVGQLLAAGPGIWSPAASFDYLWYRNGRGIAGATGSTYRLQALDGGARISLKVTGTRPGYATVAEPSAATAVVAKLLTAVPTPRISGNRYGQVLTAVPGSWAPAPVGLTYQWFLGSTPIRGATAARYNPSGAYIGKAISVAVTSHKLGYLTVQRHSGSVTLLPAVFTAVGSPRISGTARTGQVLTAVMAATSPSSSLRFQWRSGSTSIAGATRSSYRVGPLDVDRRLSVVVTAVRAGYVSVARASAGTAVVPGQVYPNCQALNAVYPHGVARVGVTFDRVRGVPTPFKGTPFFATNLYNLNPARDGDHDGIECER